MTLFHPENHTRTRAHMRLHARTELAYTIVDFLAALLFVVGSILFLKDDTAYFGTWLFIVGSVFFGVKPTIKLYRELAYRRLPPED